MRIGCGLAVVMLLPGSFRPLQTVGEAVRARNQEISASASQFATAETKMQLGSPARNLRPTPRPRLTADGSAWPGPSFAGENSLEHASLSLAVSVCLDDFEYSVACRERSSLEAAKRLEQIYLDDYSSGRAAGTLNIWFAIAVAGEEQLRFLREAEDRAIEGADRKIKDDLNRAAASAETSSEMTADAQGAIRQTLQQVERWHEEANSEARSGTNWSHDWGSRTHTYKPGTALNELARIGSHNREGD